MIDIISALASVSPVLEMSTGADVAQRAINYWDNGPTEALALVYPKSTEQVSKVLALCHEYGQTVVTQGGLTGCVSGCISGAGDIVLSLEKMNVIEEIDVVGGTATVEAGVILQTLQEAVAEQGLIFPLDLGARGSCTIGGNVATNAGGINVIRYGMMRNLVLGLEAVMADGSVVSSMNYMLKNNAGYDLKQLFIGSEGTLGVVTRVVVRLFPEQKSSHSALVALAEFSGVTQLLATLQRELAGTLSAYEVMWGDYFRAVTDEGWHRAPMARDYPYYVMLQAEGADPEQDGTRFEQILESALENELILDAVLPKSVAENRALWDIREDFEAILNPKPVYLYDVSLPLKDMANYVEQVQAACRAQWPESQCYVLGHIGDGNLHFFIAPKSVSATHAEADEVVYGPLKHFTGSVSAEHGIGTEKLAWLPACRSDSEIKVMKTLKLSLDPKNILNPGRVFTL